MPLECINLILLEKFKSENKQELILRVISRDLTGIIRYLSKEKIKGLDEILNKFEKPVEKVTSKEVFDKIEKVFGKKIKR